MTLWRIENVIQKLIGSEQNNHEIKIQFTDGDIKPIKEVVFDEKTKTVLIKAEYLN